MEGIIEWKKKRIFSFYKDFAQVSDLLNVNCLVLNMLKDYEAAWIASDYDILVYKSKRHIEAYHPNE